MITDIEAFWRNVMSWILILLVGWLFGWIHAHNTVASECEKLGSFYVGSNVYHCTKVEKSAQGEQHE